MAQFGAAQRQDGAGAVAGERAGIVGRPPVGVEQVSPRQRLAAGAVLLHGVGGDRRGAEVHQDRIARGREPEGDRVGRVDRLHAAEGRHQPRPRIGRDDQHHQTAGRRHLEIGAERGDVAGPADRDDDRAVGRHPGQGALDRVHDDDRARQHPPVDQQARAVVGDDLGIAVPREITTLELVEGARQEADPVRAVAQQVRGEDLLRVTGGVPRREPGPREQGGGELRQRRRGHTTHRITPPPRPGRSSASPVPA